LTFQKRFAYAPIAQSLAETGNRSSNAHVVKAFNTTAQEVFELAPTPLKDYGVSVFVSNDEQDKL